MDSNVAGMAMFHVVVLGPILQRICSAKNDVPIINVKKKDIVNLTNKIN